MIFMETASIIWYMSRGNERERGRLGAMAGICEFLKTLFSVCFPRRLLLLWMKPFEFILHRVMVFGVVFCIHQAIRFTRNCRIYRQLQEFEQDKAITLLLKAFSSNKPLFHSEFHFQLSNVANVSGSRLPFSWHLKLTQLKLTYPKGYTGRLPHCLLNSLLNAYAEFFLWSYRETNMRLTLRFVCVFCSVQNTKPSFDTVSSRNHDFCIFIIWGEST